MITTPRKSGNGGANSQPTTPRNITTLDLPAPMPPPLDFHSYAKKRFETIATAAATAGAVPGLSQEAIQTAQSVLKAAFSSGQTVARVQTLRLALNHYTLVTRTAESSPSSSLVYPLYDTRTLTLLQNPKRSVYLAARGQELVQWLLEQQQLTVMCTTSGAGTAAFVHIVAVLVPPPTEQGGGTFWNSVFQKNAGIDVEHWNTRCVAAMRAGAAHFALTTLYKGRDYRPTPATGLLAGPLLCTAPLEHPTMAVPETKVSMTLTDNAYCRALTQWCAQAGYRWTLVMKHHSEPGHFSHWAYFVVLLDPLDP